MARTNWVHIRWIHAVSMSCATLLLAGCGPTGILSEPSPTTKTMAAPVFSPGTGTYTGMQTVTITGSTPEAVLYYTTDGSEPTSSSKMYVSPISVKTDSTLKAISTGAGYTSSKIVVATYSIAAAQTATPVFTPVPGSYTGPQAVTLLDSTPGSNIYYTIDGTVPTTSSKLYSEPIAVTASETISAMAIAAGFGNSLVTSGTYTVRGPQAAAPAFSPSPGAYTSAQAVSLADITTGAKIYYTRDGSIPTTSSPVYAAPITVSSSEIISAIAGGPGFTSSPVASASYSIAVPAASSPTFSPDPGSYSKAQTVTLADAITGASIYYTTDGSKPTTSSTFYTGPLTVSSSQTITAIAIANGYTSSAASRATYSIGVGPSSGSAAYVFRNAQVVGGGFVDGIVMHPAQKGLMYARTDVGGAYRWDASIKQWIPLTDFLTRDEGNDMGIESIGIDPSDPNKLYLAVGTYAESFGTNGAILISNDQGHTFTTVSLPFKLGSNDKGRFAGERLSIDPNTGSHLYLGSRLNGLWESKDSGAGWSQVTSFPFAGSPKGDPSATGGVIFEAFDKGSGLSNGATSTAYVGVDDNTVSALYVTLDGGKSWAAVSGQPSGMFLNHGVIGPDRNLYLSYSNSLGPTDATAGSIWRYTLPTQTTPVGTWKNITPVPTYTYNAAAIGYGSVTVDAERPGVIMATTLDLYYLHDDVFRSLDGGNTWFDLGGNQTRDGSLSPWLNFGQGSPGIGNWLVSITIDPYDSNHVLYGTGQTVWQSMNATAADWTTTHTDTTSPAVVPTSWSVGAAGIEETVVLSLISPPSGASVISGVRDIGGFTHTSLTTSPVTGMHTNPLFVDTTCLDFAQSQPGTMVRVGNGSSNQQNGAYSLDGGYTWIPFKTQPGSASGGSIAVAADGKTFVWSPSETGTFYSTDNGTTWIPSSNAPAKLSVVSDRINPKKFYIFDPTSGTLYGSVDGGASFTALMNGLPRNGVLRSSYAGEGDVWLAAPNGLLHSTTSGANFSQIAGIQESYDVSFGKPSSGSAYPAIYMYGRLAGVQGVFRSTDGGGTWTTVTDAGHQYGVINVIAADPKIFGRIYLGTSGRGIIYADPAY